MISTRQGRRGGSGNDSHTTLHDKISDKALDKTSDKKTDGAIKLKGKEKIGGSTSSTFDDPIIEGSYTDDYNILRVHEYVMKKLQVSKSNKLIEERDRILEKIKQPQTVVERKTCLDKLSRLEEEIEDDVSLISYKRYLSESKKFIDAYRKIGPLIKHETFSNKSETEQIDHHRINIIEQYLDVASKYVTLEIVRDNKVGFYCDCGYDLSNITPDETGNFKCLRCNIDHVNIIKNAVCDEESVLERPRLMGGYEDRETFKMEIARFQGKQPINLPSNLCSKLDNYFETSGISIGTVISSLPLNCDNTRGNSSRDKMFHALQEIGFSDYYKDINLICHLYWNWALPDISHLEETIMKMYDESQRIYETIKDDRKSSINGQYRLWRHLEQLDYPCKASDFKIIKTEEILKWYEDIWTIICQRLGWKKPQPIPFG